MYELLKENYNCLDPMIIASAQSEFIANQCFDVKLSSVKRASNIATLHAHVRKYTETNLAKTDLVQAELNDELRLLIGQNQIFRVNENTLDVTTTLVTAFFLLSQVKCNPVVLPQCGEL